MKDWILKQAIQIAFGNLAARNIDERLEKAGTVLGRAISRGLRAALGSGAGQTVEEMAAQKLNVFVNAARKAAREDR